jgi:hypothetical protein
MPMHQREAEALTHLLDLERTLFGEREEILDHFGY